jgi:nucleoid-associated protein YgaU
MKRLIALTLGVATICLCAFAPFPPDTGEVIVDGIYKEASTLPPQHEIGEPEFDGEYGEDSVHHVVKKDDTLWKIAGQYHVDFKELVDLNTQFIDPDLIYPNDLVKLPINQVQGIQEAYKKFN